MGENNGHSRRERKGIILLKALATTFKWRMALIGLLLIVESAVKIAQVGGSGVGVGYVRRRSCQETCRALFFVPLFEQGMYSWGAKAGAGRRETGSNTISACSCTEVDMNGSGGLARLGGVLGGTYFFVSCPG